MELELRYDNEKEFALIENEWIAYPIGKSFIDFISVDFAKRATLYSELLAIKENPLLTFYSPHKIKEISEETGIVIEQIVRYQSATNYVLNIGNKELESLDINTRLYIYNSYVEPVIESIENLKDHAVKMKYEMQQSSTNPPNFDASINLDKIVDESLLDKTLADFHKDCKYDMIEVYSVNSLEQALYISFMKMVSNKIKVKKCKCCNKFFLVEGRVDTEFCNRLAPNSIKTCIEICALKKYHEKSNNNPIMKEFQREYKKMNARVRIRKLTQNDFYNWSENARNLRDKAIKSNWSLNEFVNELNKLEV